MIPGLEAYQNYWEVNRLALGRYLKIILVIAVGLAGYFLLEENYRYLAMVLGPLAALVFISHPRLAVYQFIIFLFSNALFSESPVVLYVDLSACILVCAAALDFFFEYSSPRGFPRLTLNWVLILAAIFVTSAAGYDFVLGIKPFARVTLMTATFLSVYRLSRHLSVKHIITCFFWVAVANAIIAVVPLITSGQVEREFGFGLKTLDDIMMITLPIGLVLYLWSSKLKGVAYLVGTGIAFVALLATQSRLPIMFSLAFSALALFLALRVGRRVETDRLNGNARTALRRVAGFVRTRIRLIVIFAVILLAGVAAFRPDMLGAVWARFYDLTVAFTGGTVALRLVLWKTAWTAFWDNPIFGIGPGNFDVIHQIYRQLRLDPIQTYVQGLSAHNLVLHYMAETGLVGASLLIALLVNQYRIARSSFRKMHQLPDPEISLILYVLAALFLVTAFFEAAWMWGQMSFVFVFFVALIVRSGGNLQSSPESARL